MCITIEKLVQIRNDYLLKMFQSQEGSDEYLRYQHFVECIDEVIENELSEAHMNKETKWQYTS